MNLTTRASDWELSSAVAIGGGYGLAGGNWFFSIRSRTAGVREPLALIAAGVGVGAMMGVDANVHDEGWAQVECFTPFSLTDLHGALGVLSQAQVGILSLSAGMLVIDARSKDRGPLFRVNTGLSGGFGGGAWKVEAAALSVVGGWVIARVASRPSPSIARAARLWGSGAVGRGAR